MNKQKKTINRHIFTQTILVFSLSIGFIFLFIFAILPLIIKITGAAKMSSAPVTIETATASIPILNSPPSYTSTEYIDLSGYGTPETNIIFIINGSKNESTKTAVGTNGEFKAQIQLSAGENIITAYATSDHTQDSTLTKRYSITFDNQAPTIELKDITDGQEIIGKNNQNLIIGGQTEAKAKVYLNERLTQSNQDGEFSITVPLNPGENAFKIKVIDQAENQTEMDFTVKFQP